MKLRRKEFCPIHRSISCCGRELVEKGSRVRRLGVQRIEDPYQMAHYRFCSTILRLSNFRITAFGSGVRDIPWGGTGLRYVAPLDV